MFCIMCKLEKERERKWKSCVTLLEAKFCQNDQPTTPCAMLEVGRLSSINAPYRIPRWKNCQSFTKTFVNELFST
jgi:hypothetical protein